MKRFNDSDSTESVIGPSVRVEGDLVSEGNLQVEGQVTGKVNTSMNLMVGQQARIQADIAAQNATVAGTVEGDIKVAETLVILETGRVLGNIYCQKLGVREGAYFSGQCNMEQGAKSRKSEPEEE